MSDINGCIGCANLLTERGLWLSTLRRYLLWSVIAHFVWEVVQLPLYTIWTEASLADNAFAIVHCTGGDLIILVAALATAVGLGYTIYSEWTNTGVRATWAYAEAMPVLPWLGTGLTPFLQWLVLPPMGLWLCRPRAQPGTTSGQDSVGRS